MHLSQWGHVDAFMSAVLTTAPERQLKTRIAAKNTANGRQDSSNSVSACREMSSDWMKHETPHQSNMRCWKRHRGLFCVTSLPFFGPAASAPVSLCQTAAWPMARTVWGAGTQWARLFEWHSPGAIVICWVWVCALWTWMCPINSGSTNFWMTWRFRCPFPE